VWHDLPYDIPPGEITDQLQAAHWINGRLLLIGRGIWSHPIKAASLSHLVPSSLSSSSSTSTSTVTVTKATSSMITRGPNDFGRSRVQQRRYIARFKAKEVMASDTNDNDNDDDVKNDVKDNDDDDPDDVWIYHGQTPLGSHGGNGSDVKIDRPSDDLCGPASSYIGS
jgi:hypothetical protein